MQKWKIRSSSYPLQDQWLTIRADQCELGNGKTIEPFYVIESADWVHIVALDTERRFVLTRQYRHAAGLFSIEFPCGVMEDGDSTPEEAAKRELREETGYEGGEWKYAATFYANPARQNNRVFVFVARGVSRVSEQHLDLAEDIEVLRYSKPELLGLIESGDFCQGLHLASYFRALPYLE